jgi:hypothetical protein
MRRVIFVPLLILAAFGGGCHKNTATSPTPTTTEPPATTFLVAPTALSMAVGDTTQIRSVEVKVNDPDEIVMSRGTWQSSNTSVASVGATGIATALSAGTADITVTVDGLSATVTVTVAASTSAAQTFTGIAATPGSATGSLSITIGSNEHAIGQLFAADQTVTQLVGRLDAATNVINVAGGGVTLLGTRSGSTIAGTYTAGASATSGFAVIDSTHVAVTTYCGTYTSDATTSLGNPDTGAFAAAVGLDGTVVGAAAVSDGASTPRTFAGRRTANALAMTFATGGAVSGSVQGDSVTGTFPTTGGATASFSASSGACH